MSDTATTVASVPAVAIQDLPACCLAAAKQGQKIVTYRCDGCAALRQFSADRIQRVIRYDVSCDCGYSQGVRVFP